MLAALDEVAASRHQATLAQVSLAWLMARPGVTAPIASATSLSQLQELLRAAEPSGLVTGLGSVALSKCVSSPCGPWD